MAPAPQELLAPPWHPAKPGGVSPSRSHSCGSSPSLGLVSLRAMSVFTVFKNPHPDKYIHIYIDKHVQDKIFILLLKIKFCYRSFQTQFQPFKSRWLHEAAHRLSMIFCSCSICPAKCGQKRFPSGLFCTIEFCVVSWWGSGSGGWQSLHPHHPCPPSVGHICCFNCSISVLSPSSGRFPISLSPSLPDIPFLSISNLFSVTCHINSVLSRSISLGCSLAQVLDHRELHPTRREEQDHEPPVL